VRQRIFGDVVCATGEHKYKIRFDNDTKKVCFSASLRVGSHDLGVLPSLPMTQQEEAQGGGEDTEEEEKHDFIDVLAGVDDEALPGD
jgi:hypothetical protein